MTLSENIHQLLHADHPRDRETALRALLPQPGAEVIGALLREFANGDVTIRRRAIRMLARWPAALPQHMNFLIQTLQNDKGWTVREAAALTLWDAISNDSFRRKQQCEQADASTQSDAVQSTAIDALTGQLVFEKQPIVRQTILSILKSDNTIVSVARIQSSLIQTIETAKPRARRRAVLALGAFADSDAGFNPDNGLSTVIGLLNDSNSATRVAALKAIPRWKKQARRCLPALAACLISRQPSVRRTAVTTWNEIREHSGDRARGWIEIILKEISNAGRLEKLMAAENLPENSYVEFASLCERRAAWNAQTRHVQLAVFNPTDEPFAFAQQIVDALDTGLDNSSPREKRIEKEFAWLLLRFFEHLVNESPDA